MRELDRKNECSLGSVEQRANLGLVAEFVPTAEQRDFRRSELFGRESQKSRGIEFIGRVDDETLLTTHQRLQRVERVHVVDGLCRLRDSERCRAPLCIEKRLSHECVRTHEA